MAASELLRGLRPFLWLALIAFMVGFLSYLALGGARASASSPPQFAPRASAPAADDWNLPKHI